MSDAKPPAGGPERAESAKGAEGEPARGRRGPVRRWAVRILKTGASLTLVYALIVLVGLFPVNRDFVEADDDGIEIFVSSTMVHAEVIVPVKTRVIDWRDEFPVRDFAGSTRKLSHVAIGWGDRGFFLECPEWSDVSVSVVGRALFWPSGSLAHVTFCKPNWYKKGRSVRVSEAQYEKLVSAIRERFLRNDDGSLRPVEDEHYTFTDAFYEAHGRYHVLNTCNSWIGNVLQEAEVTTAWLTPLPRTMFLHWPNDRDPFPEES